MQNELEPGSRFAERYIIQALLGTGGMGAVYLAEHDVLRRRVAIKIIRRHLLSGPQVMGRFQREARAACRMTHPHITQVHDFGYAEDGAPYIVLEYAEGPTLLEVLVREGPMPLSRVLDIVAQVVDALEAAHAAAVVHRDLKPGNIVLTRDPADHEVLKLLDFGLAKILGPNETATLSALGLVCGTPEYMAPEQISGGAIDHRVDLYSAGILTYELLTGRPPFQGKTMEILAGHLHQTPAPPSTLVGRATVPPQADRLVARCLAKDPTQRFQSAADLGRAIRELQIASTPQASTLIDGRDR